MWWMPRYVLLLEIIWIAADDMALREAADDLGRRPIGRTSNRNLHSLALSIEPLLYCSLFKGNDSTLFPPFFDLLFLSFLNVLFP